MTRYKEYDNNMYNCRIRALGRSQCTVSAVRRVRDPAANPTPVSGGGNVAIG